MPIARFEMPDGRVARFEVPEGTTPEQAQTVFAEFMASQQQAEPTAPAEEPGMLDKLGNLFTGADRETRATRELPELEGILAGIDMPLIAREKLALAGITTTDPMELAQIIKSAAPDTIGIQTDEKGNVLLANNDTGARAVVNKPGFSQMDAVNLGALGAAFTPAGRITQGAGLATNAAVMGARSAATQTGIEGLQASAGGDVDGAEIATAGAFGAGAPLVTAAAGKAIGAVRSAMQPAASPAVAATAPMADAVREQAVSSVGAAAKQTGRKQAPALAKLASEVQPDETILQAAERLGMREQLIPSQYSRSQAYREIEQALASIPGSRLNEQQKQAATTLAAKADDFIQQFGGTLDKSGFSDEFKDGVMGTIDGLAKQSDELYENLRTNIPQATAVNPKNTLEYLAEQAGEMGGEQFMPTKMRRLMRNLGDKPTYGRLDFLRKEIGQAMRGTGEFKDAEQGMLKQLYARLLDDQAEVASELGMSDTFDAARSLVAQRKALEDDMVKLLGKDLSGAITGKLGGAVVNLNKGDFKNFDQIMQRIPEDMRQKAVLTSLNDAFTQRSKMEKQLSASGFVDWYAGLQRNQGAKDRLFKYLPEDAKRNLNDIYQVARGMREANKERITTGRINSIKLLEEFDQKGGMLSKLYETGKGVAVAEGASSAMGLPGVGAASVIASKLSSQKTPITQAADDMLASQAFKDAVAKVVAQGGSMTPKAATAENVLTRTPAYKAWIKSTAPEVRKAIENTGFLMWLTSPSRESATTETETQR